MPGNERDNEVGAIGDAASGEMEGFSRRPGLGRKLLRIVLRMLITALVTFIAVVLFVYFYQGRMLYFPTRNYEHTPAEMGLEYEELTLVTDDKVSIAAWYVPSPRDRGTILFCHGNAGNISDRIWTLKSFHELGFNTLIFDYRGYGHSEGRTTELGTYRDADAAWDYLVVEKGESVERIVLFGRSLGGAVAIDLAAAQPPGALVVESTFTSIIDIAQKIYFWLPVRLISRFHYDSIAKIGEVDCPKLFFHAVDDELVPLENGRKLFEAAKEPKQFIETPGGHNTGGFEYSPDYTAKLAEFLDTVFPADR